MGSLAGVFTTQKHRSQINQYEQNQRSEAFAYLFFSLGVLVFGT